MSWDINRVILVGRVAGSIEVRYTPSGHPVARFSIAVGGRPRQDNTENVSFFNVVVWNKTAENCQKYLNKGNRIAVDGRLEQRSWKAADGSNRSTIEIIADRIEFLTPPGQASIQGNSGNSQSQEFIPPDDIYNDNEFAIGNEDVDFYSDNNNVF